MPGYIKQTAVDVRGTCGCGAKVRGLNREDLEGWMYAHSRCPVSSWEEHAAHAAAALGYKPVFKPIGLAVPLGKGAFQDMVDADRVEARMRWYGPDYVKAPAAPAAPAPKLCTCDMILLLRAGCKCGGR